jgi:hypothetical protein
MRLELAERGYRLGLVSVVPIDWSLLTEKVHTRGDVLVITELRALFGETVRNRSNIPSYGLGADQQPQLNLRTVPNFQNLLLSSYYLRHDFDFLTAYTCGSAGHIYVACY